MLTSRELESMRADIAQLFPDTCNILSVTNTSDGQGNQTETWGTASTYVPCRVDYNTGKETFTAGAITPYQSAVISMAYDETITTANRVQVGALTFNVLAVNNGQSWKAVTRITAELVP